MIKYRPAGHGGHKGPVLQDKESLQAELETSSKQLLELEQALTQALELEAEQTRKQEEAAQQLDELQAALESALQV